jgi:hypothetical protein
MGYSTTIVLLITNTNWLRYSEYIEKAYVRQFVENFKLTPVPSGKSLVRISYTLRSEKEIKSDIVTFPPLVIPVLL